MSVNKHSQLAEEIRAIQGQTPPVKIAGKQYVFKKLKRRDCQETLYNLVKPLVKTVVMVIESSEVDIEDLKDMDKIANALLDNVALVADIFDVVSYDQIHKMAKALLKDVIIDNSIAPDDFENPDSDDPGYYDDKQIELIQAILKAITVNYPFLGDLMTKKGGTKKDSSQSKETKKTG
jgi:hypothetical protein